MSKKPRNEDIGRREYDNSMHPVSGTECTGLLQTPPISEDEAESYSEIYDIPQTRVQKDTDGEAKRFRNVENNGQ